MWALLKPGDSTSLYQARLASFSTSVINWKKNWWEYVASDRSTYGLLVLLSAAPLEISILPHPRIVFLIPVGVMVKYALVSPPLGYGSNLIIPDLGYEVLNHPEDCTHTSFFMLLAAGWLPCVSSPRAIFLLSSLWASTMPCLAPSVSSLSCVLAEHVAEAACYHSVRQGKYGDRAYRIQAHGVVRALKTVIIVHPRPWSSSSFCCISWSWTCSSSWSCSWSRS